MAEQVTITIPEPLYRRARALAHARHSSLDFIIADALDRGLMDEPAIVGEVSESPFSSEGEAGKKIADETAAYEANHTRLIADHAGEYVAIFNGRLVDYDVDESTLLRRINSFYPDDIVLIKHVVPLPEPELRVRSPRLERR
jgi:hypothetical protein